MCVLKFYSKNILLMERTKISKIAEEGGKGKYCFAILPEEAEA